jgi:hypothetical protein
MAKYSSPKTPQDLKLDIEDDVALTVGERVAGRIVRGSHLIEQLEIGRALVVLSRVADREGRRKRRNRRCLLAWPLTPASILTQSLRRAVMWLNPTTGAKAHGACMTLTA